MRDLLVLLLIAHFLGDFHFQSHSMARTKHRDSKMLLRHLLIHAGLYGILVWLPLILNDFALSGLLLLVGVLAMHAVLDILKPIWERRTARAGGRNIPGWSGYVLDQGLHVLMLWSAVRWFVPASASSVAWIPAETLRWILLAVVITKPANITFKTLFSKYDTVAGPLADPETTSHFETEPGAGATIGNLERILSALLLASGQYAAIGLIYTAKSITRFKKIEEDRRFGEYYLIGTLYSILYVVAAYTVLIGKP